MKTKYIFFGLMVLFLAGYTGGYWGGEWYISAGNTFFHFLGGLGIALLAASYYRSEFATLPQSLRFFCILAITMGVGVFWEFHEYVLSQFVGAWFMGDLADTIKDLLMDTFGGIAGATISYLLWRGDR